MPTQIQVPVQIEVPQHHLQQVTGTSLQQTLDVGDLTNNNDHSNSNHDELNSNQHDQQVNTIVLPTTITDGAMSTVVLPTAAETGAMQMMHQTNGNQQQQH